MKNWKKQSREELSTSMSCFDIDCNTWPTMPYFVDFWGDYSFLVGVKNVKTDITLTSHFVSYCFKIICKLIVVMCISFTPLMLFSYRECFYCRSDVWKEGYIDRHIMWQARYLPKTKYQHSAHNYSDRLSPGCLQICIVNYCKLLKISHD